MKIQLKHSNVLDSGAAKQPTSPNMLDGEIAVNFNATDPAIFIKNSDGNIVRIAGKDNLSFTGYEASIQAAATPPSGLEAGNLYFDTDDNRLYYYYNDGSTTQWVDASTEKFDVTIIPDPTNLNHQSGTLDDRYVNSNGDTMTGNLVLNAGVNLNSSDVYLNNGKVVFEGANANAHEIRLTVVEPTADRVISLPDVTGTLVSTGDSGTVTSTMIADGTIQNADVSNSAGIGLSKLATGALPSGITVASTNIVNGTIVDADINSTAAIALTKLGSGALPSGITINSSGISGGVSPTDIAAGALPNNVTVASANIIDGSIVNNDISATASIQVSKLADGNAYQLLQTNAAGNDVEWSSNIDVPGTLDVTGISTFDNNVNVAGNLAVTGSTISLDANIVTIKDGNIQLGVVSTPTDVTADGGGITLKGSTDKSLSWINSTDAWTSSEHFNLASGKAFYINGSEVLNGSSLGSSITGSSLTGLGTISSGIWQGTQIVDTYLGTIATAGKVANTATTATNLNSGNAIVARDGSGDFAARNITASLIGNASTATALQTARTIALTGDLTGSASFDGSANVSINTTATFTGTTNLSYNTSTRKVESDTGTDATLPIFTNTAAGLTGASGGGTVNYLRADGTWASPPGTATNLGYTAGTSTITSSTGTGVAIPNFSSTNAGFVQGSGGGTTKFLRADGNWIALGSSSTSIGVNPPTNPAPGDSWFDTDEGRTYIYYQDTDSSQWVEANPSWNGGIPVGSVTPNYLSTGGPNWDASGNLTAAGSITAASGVITGSLTQGGNNVLTAGDTGSVTSTILADDSVTAAKLSNTSVTAGSYTVSNITVDAQGRITAAANGTVPDANKIAQGSTEAEVVDTGSNGHFKVTTEGTERMRIDSSGRLLCGTAAGAYKLVVSGGVATTGIVASILNPVSGGNSKIHFSDNATYNWTAGTVGNAFAITPTEASNSAGTPALFINSAGNVGIGDSSPSYKLTLKRTDASGAYFYGAASSDNGARGLQFTSSDNGIYLGAIHTIDATSSGGQIAFATGNTERMRIDSSGRLLLGTTNAVAFGSRQVLAVANGTTGGVISLYNSTTATANTRISSNPTGSEINDIGIHAASTNGSIIAYTNNDTERLRIDSSGRLLLGTTTEGAPAADNLTLQDSGSCGLTIRAGTSDYSTIYLSNATSGAGEYAGLLQYGHADNSLRIGTNSAERMRIDSSGNVGIGLTSPQTRLHSSGTTNGAQATFGIASSGLKISTFQKTGNDAGVILDAQESTNGTLAFNTRGSERMRIDSSGKVGIGETSMDALLVIKGNSDQNTTPSIRLKDGSDTREAWITNTAGDLVLANGGNDNVPHCVLKMFDANIMTFSTANTERMRIDSSGNITINTVPGTNNNANQAVLFQTSAGVIDGGSGLLYNPAEDALKVNGNTINSTTFSGAGNSGILTCQNGAGQHQFQATNSALLFKAGSSERMRVDSSGRLLVGTTNTSPVSANTPGTMINSDGEIHFSRDNGTPLLINRKTSDGTLLQFWQDGSSEGSISVSGTTVSYNGGHLARWSQLAAGAARTEILRGSVLSNLDEMCEWGEEDNEQLNRMKVSDVEGDKNVSGVFQAWDDDDDTYTNDFYCAMTGDFVIRIAQGTTVARGDLLMSAGDGTAKPQDDDIIRSKTIAKVTSTNVSETYADGSYCVPCVLMAC